MRRPSFLVLSTVALAAVFFGYACGGSSDSGYKAKCKQLCEKEKACPDADPIDCDAVCGMTCKNESAASAKADQCLTLTCGDALDACSLSAAALCLTDSSTGGASGATGGANGATGGTSGSTGGASGATGGASGGGDCATVCNKVSSCCTAAGIADQCAQQFGGSDIATACASAPAQTMQACQAGLTQLAALFSNVAACK